MAGLRASAEGYRRRNAAVVHAVLLVLVLCGFALRVHNLESQSLWYDEAVTANMAAQDPVAIVRWTAGDIQPPLYYLLVAGWTRLGGRGEWALRFPSAFFGVLTLPMLWTFMRRLLRQRAGWTAGPWPAGRPAAQAPGGPPDGGLAASEAQAGLVTVLLAVLSPWYLYYAQEARMYTLLVFLGLLTGYSLLRALSRGTAGNKWWAAFVFAAAAMLYTHYFGAFLLVAYAIFCVLRIWSDRTAGQDGGRLRRRIGQALLAWCAVGLLYLPWLPAVLAQYRLDRSFWSGDFKVLEALRHLAIGLLAGAPEVLLESDAVRLLPLLGTIFFLAVGVLIGKLWLARKGADRGPHAAAMLFLGLYLLAPMVGVLLLAARTPKFNPRYLMLVSPAYYALLGWGLAALFNLSLGRPLRLLGRALAVGALTCLSGAALAGIHNWFDEPAFTKAQWRELAASVQRQKGPDEAVLVVSGHAVPAWDYYAPAVSRTPLPDIEVLDVEQVLGYDSVGTLAGALRGADGVWLVQWQAETVDPVDFVPLYLDQAGAEVPVNENFWHLRLRHWRLRPDARFPLAPEPDHADGANFAHRLAVQGWDDLMSGRVTVYWRVLNQISDDYWLSLVLEDPAGHEISRQDVRPAGYIYPTTRWQAGDTLIGRYQIAPVEGLVPGNYFLRIAVYSESEPEGLDIMDVADNPSGKYLRLGPLNVP